MPVCKACSEIFVSKKDFERHMKKEKAKIKAKGKGKGRRKRGGMIVGG